LAGSLHPGREWGDGNLLAHRTLFLLRLIFAHHQTRQGQIHHLATLSSTGGHPLQILLADFTPFDLQLSDLIGGRGERQAESRVSWLPTRWLLALWAQAFGLASKPIRGGRQVAIVAIFGEPLPQAFDLLAQAAHLLSVLLEQGVLLGEQRLLLLDECISLRQLFSQLLILFSQIHQFFLDRHAPTLLGLTLFGKSQRTWPVTYPQFYVSILKDTGEAGKRSSEYTSSQIFAIITSMGTYLVILFWKLAALAF
jgi:hypothetical protein